MRFIGDIMNAEIDISNVVLKTQRLLLRPWRDDDLDDFFEYASVDGVGEMAGWSHHKTKEETKTILAAFIKEKKTFAIECGGKAIGKSNVSSYFVNIMMRISFPNLKARRVGK